MHHRVVICTVARIRHIFGSFLRHQHLNPLRVLPQLTSASATQRTSGSAADSVDFHRFSLTGASSRFLFEQFFDRKLDSTALIDVETLYCHF